MPYFQKNVKMIKVTLNSHNFVNIHCIKTSNILFNRLKQGLFNKVSCISQAFLGAMLEPKNVASPKIMTLFSISVLLW